MLFDTWNAMLDSLRENFSLPPSRRKRTGKRVRDEAAQRKWQGGEPLEDRTLLSISGTVTGNDVTFQGLAGPPNSIVFSVDGVGNLQHNLGGTGGFNSNIDLDSTVPGDQIRPVNGLTSLTYFDQDVVPDDNVTFASNAFNFVNGAFTQLSVDAGTINLSNNATILVTANGTVDLTATRNISLTTGSNIISQNGDITLSANQQPTPSLGSFVGIQVTGATISSNTGSIDVHGRGGSNLGVSNHGVQIDTSSVIRGGDVQVTGEGGTGVDRVYGVLVDSGATITSNGTGAVTVKGDGGGNNRHNFGVYVRDATIISGGGDVHVIGGGSAIGVDDNYGVYVEFTGLISAGPGGDVFVDGTGHGTGATGYGVRVGFGGTITSGGGTVQVTGVGSTTGTDNNFGVALDKFGSQITSGGTGSVIVVGTGNGTGNLNVGVWLETGGKITSNGGDVVVTGTGGNGLGATNHGVNFDATGGEISAGGSGTVTINGTGGNATGDSNRGVSIDGPTSVITQPNGGSIFINGTGNGGVGFSAGVYIANGGQIRGTGAGDLSIQGTGGSGAGDDNFGVIVDAAILIAVNGDLTITGLEGSGTTGVGIKLRNAGTSLQTTGVGNINLNANSIDLGVGTNVNAGTHRVTIVPLTVGTNINLGVITDPLSGPLNLTDAELDRVTAGTLKIGGVNSDTITVSAAQSRPASTDVELAATNDIVISGGQIDTAGGTLLLQTTGVASSVRPTLAGVDATASSVTLDSQLTVNITGLNADTQHTQFNVNGSVDLFGAKLILTGGNVFAVGDSITIVSATGAITGTFAGLPEDGTIDFNGQALHINYTAKTVKLTLPVPNSPPTIISGTSTNVNENTLATTVVFDVDATDSDLPAQTLNYSLSGTDASQFSIDAATGEIRFLSSPDFEIPTDSGVNNVYNATVTVNDGNGGIATQDITITVLPLNDNTPAFTSLATAAVDENTPASVVAIDVNATDADLPGDTLTYVLSGTDAGKFNINVATGEIRFNGSPDFEAPTDVGLNNTYDVTVTVNDGKGLTRTQDIAISVSPVNDFVPVVTSPAAVNVNENTPASTVILTLAATDADLPSQTLFYDLGGIDAGFFSADPLTHEVRFLSSPDFETRLDADADNNYELTLTVSDGSGGITVQAITITVLPLNDNSPVFVSPNSATVNENTATSFVVLAVEATDDDLPAQTVTYSLSGVDAGQFHLDTVTGEIQFNNIPDHEAPTDAGLDNVYNLSVKADDGNGRTSSQDITITVLPLNDNAPQITSGNLISVNENTSTLTAIHTVVATDADTPPQTLGYSLSGADSARFTIDSNGILRFVANPDFEAPADAGADNIYNVNVIVDDGNGLTTIQGLTINVLPVNDNAPLIGSPSSSVVSENISTAAIVLDVDATDADLPAQTLSYSLSGIDAAQFTINTASGEIQFLNSPNFEGPGDAGTDNIYNITVRADDGDGGITTQDITVTVTDFNETPSAKDGILAPLEDTATSGTLLATDPDAGTTLKYSLMGNPLHGNVVIDDPFTGAYTYTPNTDYNGPDSFTFIAQDGSNTSSPATVTVAITPVNDTPAFTKGPNQAVLEDASAQSILAWATGIVPGPVSAIDEAGQLLTFIVSNDNNALFSTQPAVDAAGRLTYAVAPNANGSATVTVLLRDSGGTANGASDTSLSQTFTITVTPTNDPPVVNDVTFVIREDATAVGTLTVNDPDLNDAKTYSIISGDPAGTFAIDSQGRITVLDNAPLEVDPHPTYNLKVRVTDSGNLTTTADVTIQVTDALVIILGSSVQDYVRSSGSMAIDSDAIARDSLYPDINYNGGHLVVTITNPQDGDRLGLFNQGTGDGRISVLRGQVVYQSSLVIIGTLIGGQNGTRLEIALTSFATQPAVDALLKSIWFRNSSSRPVAGPRNIKFELKNGAGDERDTKTKVINLVTTLPPLDLSISEGLIYNDPPHPIALAPDASVTDTNYNGGRLTVTRTLGTSRKQRLSMLPVAGIEVAGKVVSYQGHVIGRLTLKQNSLVVDFTGSAATKSAVDALLHSIAFSSDAGGAAATDPNYRFTLTDSHGRIGTANRPIFVS